MRTHSDSELDLRKGGKSLTLGKMRIIFDTVHILSNVLRLDVIKNIRHLVASTLENDMATLYMYEFW